MYARQRSNLWTWVLALSAALATPALAQESTTSADETLQEVIVTGSYIPRTDRETVSPVTIISSQDIAQSGLTTVADVVRTLSADNSGTLPTAFSGAFAAGASGIALRGLTVNSTLVLIDGLRAADYALPDDGVRDFVDLNSIQIGTIDHIEVLQDGASSVYGADAIGGVVNIILKKQYQGFSANAEVGNSQHGGGFEKHLDFTAGVGDLANDHYNAYISVEYQHDNAIGIGQRGFPYNSYDYTSLGGTNHNANPDYNAGGSIYGSVTPGTLSVPGNLLTGVPLPGAVSQPLVPCPASAPAYTSPQTGNVSCNQNQSPYLDDQPPTERLGVSGRFTAQLNDTTQAYMSVSYYQNKSIFPSAPAPYGPAQIATSTPNNTLNIALPVTIPGPGGAAILNPNNPFAAAGNVALINYAFGPLGSETSETYNHNLRVVMDLSGQWGGWNYDGSAVVNHTWLDYQYFGFLNFNQLLTDVTNGSYNFVDPSANSPAVLKALSPVDQQFDTSDMDTLVLRASRSLLQLPGGPLGIAFGAEWRYEAEYDPNFNANPVIQGLGYSQAIGSRNIASADVDIDAPLLKSLEVTASGRFDHYSDFGNSTTPKFGVKYKPFDALMLRGTYSQGFRAPSFAENGSSEVEGFEPGFGFCPSPLCTAHGADAYISSYTLGELTTANPNIKPERSHSYTFGTVIEPIKAFSATFDYYYIKKTNLIFELNPNAALTQYGTNGTLPAGFSAIYDAPDPLNPAAPPRILTITTSYANVASEYTDGFDVDLRGQLGLGAAGNLTSDLSFTKIMSFVYEQPGTPNLQYAGTQSPYILSSGAGTPKWRGKWTNTWNDGPLTLSAIVYYVSGYGMYGYDLAPVCLDTLTSGIANPGDCHVASFTDIDLTGSYQLTKQWQVTAAIQNVADIKPPYDPANYAGDNYNPTYSQAGIIGRFFRLGVHYRFD
jgi:iron complex outermembrane receptor protein